jgi:hypothetical protein
VKTSISRFTIFLLGGLATLTTGCSATTTATTATTSATVTVTTTPPASGASSTPASAPSTAISARPASSAPSGPGSAPACTTAQLALRIGGGLVSGGTDIYFIYFTNASGKTCALRGYPVVSAVTGPDNTAQQVGDGAQPVATPPATTQVLQPGAKAQATLRFAHTGNFTAPQCHHVNVLYLSIFPPGQDTAAYAGIDEQTCDQTTLPTMTITTIGPDHA